MPITSLPPGARRLAVGRLALLLDGADLRYVTLDGIEIVRRLTVAIRDQGWGTLEPDELTADVRERGDTFEIRARARHSSAAADVAWSVVARVAGCGELTYEVELTPQAPFAYARMGLCLLHPPAALIGARYAARTPQGEVTGGFEQAIVPQRMEAGEPQPLFPAFSALRIDSPRRPALDLRFAGDLFEMEDQRNWSDGSFKTYGTPLSVPRPHHAEPGRPVSQRIALTPSAAPTRPARARALQEPVAIRVAAAAGVARVPGIGLALSGAPLSAAGERQLGALALEHLRVDLRAAEDAAARLARAAGLAERLGTSLTPVVHLRDEAELAEWEELLRSHAGAIARLLVFHDEDAASGAPLVAAARRRLAGLLPRARFVGGTDHWFADLNRARPDPAAMDGVAWAISPQVHASDDLSLVEALAPQADQVATARGFAQGLELVVGPVTLSPRRSSADRRQRELFAAAWTAASFAQLATAGATAVTYFETAGPRGVLGIDAAGVAPCWHPLADAGAWAGWAVLAADSAEPLAAQALVARSADGASTGILVANLRSEPTTVRLAGLPAGEAARVRLLDADTRASACADPLAHRASGSAQTLDDDGSLPLALAAHAVATVLVSADP
jgi:hypothetical protein